MSKPFEYSNVQVEGTVMSDSHITLSVILYKYLIYRQGHTCVFYFEWYELMVQQYISYIKLLKQPGGGVWVWSLARESNTHITCLHTCPHGGMCVCVYSESVFPALTRYTCITDTAGLHRHNHVFTTHTYSTLTWNTRGLNACVFTILHIIARIKKQTHTSNIIKYPRLYLRPFNVLWVDTARRLSAGKRH